ncbi:hypothetical protein Tco_1345617 [Tanacetum coccineum]
MATKPKLDADLNGEPKTQLTTEAKSVTHVLDLNEQLFHYADHAGCVDTRKSTSGGIQFLGDKLVSWMSKNKIVLQVPIREEAEVSGVICKLCSSNVDADTALRLWIQLQQNTIVLRLSVSHSNIMQPRAALSYQAHPYSGIMPTKIELTLEQSQQGVSNDVLSDILFIFTMTEWKSISSSTSNSNCDRIHKDEWVMPHSAEVGFITTCSCFKLLKTSLMHQIQES